MKTIATALAASMLALWCGGAAACLEAPIPAIRAGSAPLSECARGGRVPGVAAFPVDEEEEEEATVPQLVQGGLQDFRQQQMLDSLYSDGLIVPNQPLPMTPGQREKARSMVQNYLRAAQGAGMRLKRDEREMINTLLFNYGLQVLDDGRVVVLEVYQPDWGLDSPMLSPDVPMPAGAVTITQDNLQGLSEKARADASARQAASSSGKRSARKSQLIPEEEFFGKDAK